MVARTGRVNPQARCHQVGLVRRDSTIARNGRRGAGRPGSARAGRDFAQRATNHTGRVKLATCHGGECAAKTIFDNSICGPSAVATLAGVAAGRYQVRRSRLLFRTVEIGIGDTVLLRQSKLLANRPDVMLRNVFAVRWKRKPESSLIEYFLKECVRATAPRPVFRNPVTPKNFP